MTLLTKDQIINIIHNAMINNSDGIVNKHIMFEYSYKGVDNLREAVILAVEDLIEEKALNLREE